MLLGKRIFKTLFPIPMKKTGDFFFSPMKYFLLLFTALFLPTTALAAEIQFSADTNAITTDETLTVHLSVDGQIDNGQVGIEGLENFSVVGQQSSSQMQILNGQASVVQEKIFSLAPKTSGEFSLRAIAYVEGEKIESDTISVSVEKSLLNSTKEKILQESEKKTNTSFVEQEEHSLPPPISEKSASPQVLNISPLSDFPAVEHISAFNALFWLEFLGILLLLLGFFLGITWGIRRKK